MTRRPRSLLDAYSAVQSDPFVCAGAVVIALRGSVVWFFVTLIVSAAVLAIVERLADR